jgi:hypothetical protein
MTIEGPIHIELYRLMATRSALKLEVRTGMQMSRGRSAASVARTIVALPKRNKAELLAQLEAYIETFCANNGLSAPSWVGER